MLVELDVIVMVDFNSFAEFSDADYIYLPGFGNIIGQNVSFDAPVQTVFLKPGNCLRRVAIDLGVTAFYLHKSQHIIFFGN